MSRIFHLLIHRGLFKRKMHAKGDNRAFPAAILPCEGDTVIGLHGYSCKIQPSLSTKGKRSCGQIMAFDRMNRSYAELRISKYLWPP